MDIYLQQLIITSIKNNPQENGNIYRRQILCWKKNSNNNLCNRLFYFFQPLQVFVQQWFLCCLAYPCPVPWWRRTLHRIQTAPRVNLNTGLAMTSSLFGWLVCELHWQVFWDTNGQHCISVLVQNEVHQDTNIAFSHKTYIHNIQKKAQTLFRILFLVFCDFIIYWSNTNKNVIMSKLVEVNYFEVLPKVGLIFWCLTVHSPFLACGRFAFSLQWIAVK